MMFDRSAAGSPRLALFPAALTLFDPYIWECFRNSLVIAVATAALALVWGVVLGWMIARFRPTPLRPILGAFAALSVMPPIVLVAGLTFLGTGAESAFDRIAEGIGWGLGGRGVQLLWAESCWAGAWVVVVTVAGLRRIDPSWEDAARLAGATQGQIALRLIWPRIRAELYRTAGLIVLAVLFEPTGPLILEVRRTLAFQILEAASLETGGPECAVLTVMGLCGALIAQGVLRVVGGPVKDEEATEPPRRIAPVPWIRRLLVVPPLLGALVLGWMPILILLYRLTAPNTFDQEDFRALLTATRSWEAIGWTLALAGLATIAGRLTFRVWDRLAGAESRLGLRPMLPGDGIPPSFLCALLVLMVVRGFGLAFGPGVGRLGSEWTWAWDFRLVWRAAGFQPLLLAAALWLTMVLSVVRSPLAWRSGSCKESGDGRDVADRSPGPRITRVRDWRDDFALLVTLAGPAMLFAGPGGSLASRLVLGLAGGEPSRQTAFFCLLLAAFSLAFRGRRAAAF
jgi:ABC-type spermidine/putrescine transport system permease subunit II